jgi:hypothetical protein
MRSVLISPLIMRATATSSAIIAGSPPVNQPQQHKERLSRPQGKHNINPHLIRLLRRTPAQTPTTLQPYYRELARGLWDMWSSCCSSRCTCPRTTIRHCLISMRSVLISPLIMHAEGTSSAIIAGPPARQPTTTTKRALVETAKQAHDQSAPVQPPAKNTNPDANDAAAR